MSLQTGRYFTLDESASRMWVLLSRGLRESEVALRISREQSSPVRPTEIVEDVREFADSLHHRHLLHPWCANRVGDRQQSRFARVWPIWRGRAPSLATCFATLFVIDAGLRLFGLARVLKTVRARTNANPRQLSTDWLHAMLRNIYVASAWYPWRAACLEQSLAILALLRRYGSTGSLRIGIHVHPFSAHAWVDYFGQPLNETTETIMRYRVFPPIDPEFL